MSHLDETGMPQKKHKPEEIAAKIRLIDLFVTQSPAVGEAVRSSGMMSYCRFCGRQVKLA